jgi:NitT/TauT family transport system substrate-binding protein
MRMTQTRRRFLTTLSFAGAASLVRAPRIQAAEGPLETTAVRLSKVPALCFAPQYAADELLRAEGFTDIRYVEMAHATLMYEAIARGEVDIGLNLALSHIRAIDAGQPITVIGGVHGGCYELFAGPDIRSLMELKGKSVGVLALGSSPHAFLSVMAANVGLDPVKDVRWVTSGDPLELFTQGKIDAFLGFPPEPQELRTRNVGHAIVNTAIDRPWSHYFCCMLAGSQDYVRKYPVATKRVLRAVLKAADLCAADPARAARRLVDGGFASRYDYALQTLREVAYDRWREYDAEDTIRFYALRLHETGFAKSSPQKIIADGTDWRFLNELKRELKA